MDEKEVDEGVVNADAATADGEADKHASTLAPEMDPIDYVSLLMEQEHR